MTVVNCLQSHHNRIFKSDITENSVTVYYDGRVVNQICSDVVDFLSTESVISIAYHRHSTAIFYSAPGSGLKTIQTILIYAPNESALNSKVSSDMKFIVDKGKDGMNFRG